MNLTFSRLLYSKSSLSVSQIKISDIKLFIKDLSQFQREQLKYLTKLMKLILVLPCSNATSDPCFSTLRRIKTYLRTTMLQQRLNNLMILNIYKERVDTLTVKDICQLFVNQNLDYRTKIFGTFNE